MHSSYSGALLHLEDGAWLWEAGGGALRGHSGCHGLCGALRLRQGRQWQRLGQCLEDWARLGQATYAVQEQLIDAYHPESRAQKDLVVSEMSRPLKIAVEWYVLKCHRHS